MPIVTTTRTASAKETAAEMDRRGSVIERLEAERDLYLEALRDIDSVGVDFGHFEAAARTMQEHARTAIAKASSLPVPSSLFTDKWFDSFEA